MANTAKPQRTPEQLRFHYEVEKDLADQLRRATPKERRAMYGRLYDELYKRVKDHPLLKRKEMTGEEARHYRGVQAQMGLLGGLLHKDVVFLEVGAGSCILSMQASAKVKRVISLDVSQEMASRNDLPPNMEIRIFDGIEIPVEPGSINVAYSHQVMEHVHPEDAIEQLSGIYRALAPGGVYLCVVPNRLSGPHDISRFFDKVATGFHMKEYTTIELAAIFRQIGFRKTCSYVGARGHYFSVPQFSLKTMEGVLDSLPFGLRFALTRKPPLRPLLEIRMAGWK
ncbi:MAG TPA: class I SAM-dependent methyltransferase [Verrucomicrobiae bacterium]|jgi:SAM-dependent methyltransferase